jgi:hypothetical protein
MKTPADKTTEFWREAASVRAALEEAESELDWLDFDCTSWMAGRILKAMADHLVDTWKLLAKLIAAETAQ